MGKRSIPLTGDMSVTRNVIVAGTVCECSYLVQLMMPTILSFMSSKVIKCVHINIAPAPLNANWI